MITNIQRKYLEHVFNGTIKKKDDPKTYSAYKRRMRTQIDRGLENLVWVAEHCPDILKDTDYELSKEEIPLNRRARALLKAVSLFENEPTVLMLIAEIYTKHNIEVSRKDY